jgi:YbbR domain-containing protein
MRQSESGKMTFKAILSLAFFAALIFASFKIIPVYVNDYELNDYIQSQTPFWQTQHASADAVRKNVLAKAQDLSLPLAAEEVTVEVTANKVSVTLDYHVPVDLKVYTLQLHFTHSSENRSI